MAKSDEGKSLAEIYFGRLSDSEFVKLCKEILEKKNFTGLEILDGPGDRGNDIIGDEIIKTELGSEKRRCLIQCKHYIKSGKNVSDEEVRTTAGSLSQRNCKSALIITSTTLTPQAKHSILHFREKDEIPFYYWDAEYLSGLLNNKLFLEIVMKYNIGGVGLFGAVIRNIRELNMHVAVFSGCDANPLVIDFENYSIDSLSPKLKVERHPPFRFKVTGFNKASKVNFDRFGNSNYIQDTFWKKFALFEFRKERLLAEQLITKYVSDEYEKRGKPERFPIELLQQQDVLERLMSPPLLNGLYHISWEVYQAGEVNVSLREVKEAFCAFISQYLTSVKSDEWFVVLFSNPMALCYVENTSKLRASMVVLPEYKSVFDPFPIDNDWIGLPNGKADEKSKWLFGLATSFSEPGTGAITIKIDPDKDIEGYVSITPRDDIPHLYELPMTYGDLTNIPDLRARWFFHRFYYLRPENINDSDFIEALNKFMKKEEKATFMETKRANLMVIKANLAVPDELQDLVSEYTVYMGGDPWTDDERLWNYCKEKGLVNYKNQGSVFLMLTLAFRTKSLDPSYTISEKFASKADSIAKTIEENISTSLKAPFKRMTLKRRDTYYDYHNNNTKGT